MSDQSKKFAVARRTFAGDKRGIAALEFTLIAPILLILLVGVIEVTRAVSIDRRFGKVTSMVADLLTRETEPVSAATVEGIYGVVDHVMGVWGTDTLKLHITPVRAAATDRNDIYVYAGKDHRPSFGSNATSPRDICDSFTGLTNNMLEAGGTAIVVEGEYGFAPLIAEGVVPATTWEDRAVFAPRNSTENGCVSFEGGPTDCNPPECPGFD